jgi:hypothetical protein
MSTELEHSLTAGGGDSLKRKAGKACVDDDEAQSWNQPSGSSETADKPDHHVGKWTAEEEVYSEYLIHLFLKGNITDCEENTTLRAYLAEKLNCKPMRITKKKYLTEFYDGKLTYVHDVPSVVYLKNIRDNYLSSKARPNLRRSHKKKKISNDLVASSGIYDPSEWLRCSDADSWFCSGVGGVSDCKHVDMCLVPDDIEVMMNQYFLT